MPPKPGKKNTTIKLERHVPGLLLWLSNKLSASASQTYRKLFGLGIVEWRILSYLGIFGWGTGAQMSQLMGTDKAAMSRGAAVLQEKGLVKSRSGLGRNLEFGLTKKGQKIHDRIAPLAIARGEVLLSGLSAAEVDTLIRLLHVLLDNLSAVETMPTDGY
jgi:DNA-binding MarR family transcriptional regulator